MNKITRLAYISYVLHLYRGFKEQPCIASLEIALVCELNRYLNNWQSPRGQLEYLANERHVLTVPEKRTGTWLLVVSREGFSATLYERQKVSGVA